MSKPIIHVTNLIVLSIAALLNLLFIYPFFLIQYTIYIFIITGLFFNTIFSFFAIRKKALLVITNILILLLLSLFVIFIYFTGEGGYPPAIDLFNNEINP